MHVSLFDKVAKHFQVIVIETLLTRSAHIICVRTSTAKYYYWVLCVYMIRYHFINICSVIYNLVTTFELHLAILALTSDVTPYWWEDYHKKFSIIRIKRAFIYPRKFCIWKLLKDMGHWYTIWWNDHAGVDICPPAFTPCQHRCLHLLLVLVKMLGGWKLSIVLRKCLDPSANI